MHGLPGSTDHDLNSQLRQYAADKSSRDYCFGMPEPKNSVVCGIHLQLQVIVQGDKIPWYYHDTVIHRHAIHNFWANASQICWCPILSMNEIAHMSCPESFFPNIRYSVSSLVNRILNRWSTVDRWIASIFGQWSTGFNDDHTKQNSELDIWIHQWPVHLLQLNSVSRGAQSVQLSLHMSLLKRGKWNQQMQTS